jgi:peptidoglycan hydrolase-like protein with peptidoglycan-binding domain
MANPGQPTVRVGDSGEPVRRAQRALRRTPNTSLMADGSFGPQTEAATKQFQQQAGLPVTGVVDEATWTALPTGSAMPVLSQGRDRVGVHGRHSARRRIGARLRARPRAARSPQGPR